MLEEAGLAPNVERKMRLDRLQRQPEVVGEILKEHVERQQQTEGLTLRKLSPGVKAMIWFLRLYVVFMTVVVVVNVVQTVHP
ncbi:MAG: hypothetical protein OWU32_06720 [Firmicutes bacterium]|nr:hypothetical protein [Bacillota bacterium]